MNKDEVTFGDLFNAISEINRVARPDENNKKLITVKKPSGGMAK